MSGRDRASATLWDRTRQLASQEILETALRLFTEQGYDETTTAQIAREAGVSQRTLFRCFGSKEDLLGGDQDRFGRVLADTIGEQPAETGVWEALRAGWLEKRLRFQEELLPLVEARMDATAGTAGARARAVLATAFACLDAASMTWVAGDGQSTILDLYDECLTAVRG